MITKEEYEKALAVIIEFEKHFQETENMPCYILVSQECEQVITFVTTDKEYADRMYETGKYIKHISKLINPKIK